MKKIIIIILSVILLGTAGFFGYKTIKNKKKTEETKQVVTKKRQEVNLLELTKRPYITLIPRTDGRELFLNIENLKLKEELVEYELEYQAGTMIQGAFGRIDFLEEKPPVRKGLLLGSCSKGKCRYDEDVTGGSLTLYFEGSEDYSLKGEFTIGTMLEKKGIFSSRDAKVTLEIEKGDLSESTFLVVSSTMGLPKEVKGEVVSGPIGFFTASKTNLTKSKLTFKTDKDLENPMILGWDGTEWQEYEVEKVTEGYSTLINNLTTFVLVN
ncbi:hypothetical protein COT75_02780 [Candidatus Beckwithbacteria bacterium CG10_big_fil_rev_8_21_14_0_10_34_10]|uniref:Uncharacterized protein n=1 Tax=Candidatus Beckwithbacteria bacterium CG10_big_fil_rev_8_21_14_0_10_34_10 TaxID=1974495 RepID=A0A2H0W921_9BACT|nr:MAG: hypothetical protein COT75_02780 [Candidatus Beckwithbacteria bacterium CG10_big_fil_rev_8_21_14_0_10_34_10]